MQIYVYACSCICWEVPPCSSHVASLFFACFAWPPVNAHEAWLHALVWQCCTVKNWSTDKRLNHYRFNCVDFTSERLRLLLFDYIYVCALSKEMCEYVWIFIYNRKFGLEPNCYMMNRTKLPFSFLGVKTLWNLHMKFYLFNGNILK